MAESLQQIAARELESTKCRCGHGKDEGEPFCTECVIALPRRLMLGLFATWSDDFASNWDEAKDYLQYETDRFN